MFSAAIIVFREVLEAALIIGIIAAAARNLKNKNYWIFTGIIAGLLGAAIIASITNLIIQMASGLGQELLNILILCAAILMLAWHNIWMSKHGKKLAQQANQKSININEGRLAIYALFSIAALAVLREGSETVLFLYGITTANNFSIHSTLLGGLFGLIGGCALGFLLYFGLIQIPVRWFFGVTGGMLLLLAGGMAAQVAQLLNQADILNYLSSPLWDSSQLITQDSILGTFLHVLLGYSNQPTGLQLLFFSTTILLILFGMKLNKE